MFYIHFLVRCKHVKNIKAEKQLVSPLPSPTPGVILLLQWEQVRWLGFNFLPAFSKLYITVLKHFKIYIFFLVYCRCMYDIPYVTKSRSRSCYIQSYCFQKISRTYFSCSWSLHILLLFFSIISYKNYKLIWPALNFSLNLTALRNPLTSPSFSDVLVAFLYLIFATGKYQNMEKPLQHQRRLGLPIDKLILRIRAVRISANLRIVIIF